MKVTSQQERAVLLQTEIRIGQLYRHYSGKIYKVLSIARHTEHIDSLMVVYQGIYTCPTFGKSPIWCRPYEMFTEMVEINGVLQPRFAALEDIYTEDFYHHGIKFLIRNNENEILILLYQDGYCDLPGGRMQMNDASYEAGGKREVLEETGISDLTNITYVGTVPSPTRITLNQQQTAGLIYSLYSAKTGSSDVIVSDEHDSYQWIKKDQIADRLKKSFDPLFVQLVTRCD